MISTTAYFFAEGLKDEQFHYRSILSGCPSRKMGMSKLILIIRLTLLDKAIYVEFAL